MPVKCPVSSIVKQRKVQGREYFEVSWEDIEGLKASVVPADLVERYDVHNVDIYHFKFELCWLVFSTVLALKRLWNSSNQKLGNRSPLVNQERRKRLR